MNIIVLAGGLSTEREVSLSSGASICQTLREMGHHAFLLDVYFGLPEIGKDPMEVFSREDGGLSIAKEICTTAPDLEAIRASRPGASPCFLGPNVAKLCTLADITFLALHGDVGENGKLQATFDLLGIRYTGSHSLGCALSMDKEITKEIFRSTGVPTPKGGRISWKETTLPALSSFDLSLPVVVKPCAGGSSIGVSICHEKEEYEIALTASRQRKEDVLVEEYIKGREFAVGILDGKALPVIEIVPNSGWFDYAHKYQTGCTEEICPAPLPEEITACMQRAAEKAFSVLKLTVYARADFLLQKDGTLYCLEVNSLPGMTSASLLPKEANAAGMDYKSLCQWIIDCSLKRYS